MLNSITTKFNTNLKRTCSPAELDCVQAVTVNQTECPHYCEGIVMGVERPYSVIDEKELVNFFADYENFKYPDGSNLTFPQAMAGEYDRFDSIEFSKIKKFFINCRTSIYKQAQVRSDFRLNINIR